MTKKPRPSLPRAVRELLRDVVLQVRSTFGHGDEVAAPRTFSQLSLDAARILGTTPGTIVSRARKAGRR
jgi:hypothetical protein